MQNRQLAEEVIGFLEEQRLEPLPVNYALGYLFLTGEDEEVARAVSAIVDGRVRISQSEVEAIMAAQGFGRADGGRTEAIANAVRRQALRLVDLTAETARATGEFGRDIAANLDQLDAVAEGRIALRDVAAAMIERTAIAEKQLADATAEAIQLRADLEEARLEAMADHLTGLPNRRGINAEIERLVVAKARWSAAIIDIDDFKLINDRWGHGVGDRVLKAVASTLAEACAPHFTGRWGGEEFVVLFEGLDVAAATAIVDKARETVGDRRMRLRETDQPLGRITFSAGVAEAAPPDAPVEEGDTLERADERLYAAKEAGKDRVLAA
ncbi:GGDEF domain-containing protein [Sphingomonas gilva]|uniref:diguanylate cyclase n=1 Tax=Sphingomonas gilva TaxID=2305907 RepID=A0A396RKW7_9SPHN|nr:GGDEF domain-containing protein [Sphingomonas gilva]RHW16927.1 GGDEF domain-containing protein [Sphingomonas gilva]